MVILSGWYLELTLFELRFRGVKLDEHCSRCMKDKSRNFDYGNGSLDWDSIFLDDVQYTLCPKCVREVKIVLIGGSASSRTGD